MKRKGIRGSSLGLSTTSFVKITLKRHTTTHSQCLSELSMPQHVWATTPHHNKDVQVELPFFTSLISL